MVPASDRAVADVAGIIRLAFQHWGAALPAMLHIWRDAGDIHGPFAGQASLLLTRKLAFVVDMQALLKAWLQAGKGDPEMLKALLAQSPDIIAGLREASALAEARYNRYRRNRRFPKAKTCNIADVMLEKENLSETIEALEDEVHDLVDEARTGVLTDERLEEFEIEKEEAKEWLWEIGVQVKRLKAASRSASGKAEFLPLLAFGVRGERRAITELEEAIDDLRSQTKEAYAMLEVRKELDTLRPRRGSRGEAVGLS